MQHPMAVGADRAKVLHGVDLVLLAYIRELPKVVDLDVRGAQIPVG